MAGTDSAGVPWEGRSFDHNQSSDDDGSAPERLIEALRRFRSRELGEAEVVAALRESRLLIPLVAVLGEAGRNEDGVLIDKSQELSIVTVAGPDGRNVLPVFTSVTAMSAWNPKARPVPADAVRVALAAASEQTELVVLDPTSSTEFVLRRPALWAIAQGAPWKPSYLDEDVLAAFLASARPETAVLAVQLAPDDPDARLSGSELLVHLTLADGLDQEHLTAMLSRLQQRWSDDDLIANRVDSLRVQLAAAH
ncbi:SseB family protein [Glaciihabitans sp. dw_435]|uniref:SseB family protein n=1 Tax=Glaciihabitans sp. dw_435 TaxID=2720081 RepID=UPI001BD2C2D6|nr:SseB family protein [Glaciihabitans sp. dw_435]